MVEEARENPNGEKGFPWGAAIGLGVAGVIAAVVIIKWDDIVAAINPPPVVIKKTIATQQSYYQPPANTQTSSQTSVSETTTTTTTKTPTQTKYPEPTPSPQPSPAPATPTSGSYSGRITDNVTQAGISGAVVTFSKVLKAGEMGPPPTKKIATNSTGYYEQKGLSFGDYDVYFEAKCYDKVGPLRYTLKQSDFMETTVPLTLNANLQPQTYEDFEHPTDLPGGKDNALTYTFCKPRIVSQAEVSAKLHCWWQHWADINAALITNDGREVSLGSSELQCASWHVRETPIETRTIGGQKNSSGQYLNGLGLFKGIKVWKGREGITDEVTIRVTYQGAA